VAARSSGLYEHVRSRLEPLLAKRAVATQKVMLTEAAALQLSMRSNHPWVDRTGEAERGLFATALPPRIVGNRQTFEMQAGFMNVPYGRRLELDEGGKYAIVGPSVRTAFPRISATVRATRAAIR
jgi:hypothetical protein